MLVENMWERAAAALTGAHERQPQKSRHDLREVGRPRWVPRAPQQVARFGRSAQPCCWGKRRCGIRPTWPPVPSWAIGMASGFRTHRFRLYRKRLWFAICHMWRVVSRCGHAKLAQKQAPLCPARRFG